MIYLSAPFSTGIQNKERREDIMVSRAREINRVAAEMIAAGQVVYSPVTHAFALQKKLTNLSHKDWMKQCLGILRHAERVVVLALPGWKSSKGVRAEIRQANLLGVPVEIRPPNSQKGTPQ